ncbi:hypothetical protein [Aquibium microcysteis]|uniref:hypothetical protein n=1 Tax=Aquibium microcysteis TaxID=675281 RepID=UPI001EF3911A|nr:hypothetical protein [Aquibium microcysteis]
MAFVAGKMRFAALAALMALAGCQSGGALDLGLGGWGTKKAEPAAPPAESITADELRAYCPRVTLRSGTAFYSTYERGGDGDRNRIVYQASITDVTRSCRYDGGMLNMEVAAAGRVVPGPVAKDGTITMPIRIAVVRGEEVLYSRLHQHQTAIAALSPATQFVFKDPAVSIPVPTARNIEIYVGFDETPQKKR